VYKSEKLNIFFLIIEMNSANDIALVQDLSLLNKDIIEQFAIHKINEFLAKYPYINICMTFHQYADTLCDQEYEYISLTKISLTREFDEKKLAYLENNSINLSNLLQTTINTNPNDEIEKRAKEVLTSGCLTMENVLDENRIIAYIDTVADTYDRMAGFQNMLCGCYCDK
jgi:hypothetical protein